MLWCRQLSFHFTCICNIPTGLTTQVCIHDISCVPYCFCSISTCPLVHAEQSAIEGDSVSCPLVRDGTELLLCIDRRQHVIRELRYLCPFCHVVHRDHMSPKTQKRSAAEATHEKPTASDRKGIGNHRREAQSRGAREGSDPSAHRLHPERHLGCTR